MKGKIQEIIKIWPQDTIAVSSWLELQGVSPQLCHKYIKSGWIKSLSYGAYTRLDDKPQIQGAIFGLQQGLGINIHVGALTALELIGQAHFIPLGKDRPYYLFSHSKKKKNPLPKWFLQNFPNYEYFDRKLFTKKIGLKKFDTGNFHIVISTTERALFEILALVPKIITFKHASQLFEGKETLRAKIIQQLLENCNSQLLKRFFLYFLHTYNLPILNKLDLNKVDLGKGLRRIGNGKFHEPTFNLMLPELIRDENIEI